MSHVFNFTFGGKTVLVSAPSATALTTSTAHQVIVVDASVGLLHLSLEFAKSPADVQAIRLLQVLAFVQRTEGVGHRFALEGHVLVEKVRSVDGNTQSLFLQEGTAQAEAVIHIRRPLALQADVRRASPTVKAETEVPWQGLLRIEKEVSVEAVVALFQETFIASHVGIRSTGVDGESGLVARIPVHP